MLLEDRDKWREVDHGDDYPPLSTRQKQALIRDFAYRMLRNGESDVSIHEADGAFNSRLDAFDLPAGTTGLLIRRLFVERTNLLRELVPGRVDFAHRTFQEFLAAEAIARGHEIDFLLQKVGDDQWRETIVLAAGLCELGEVAQLLRGLLMGGAKLSKNERKEELATRRTQGQALAIACLETCVELPRALRQEVLSQAKALFSPQTDEVARGVAAAGDLAVPYLVAHADYSEHEAARCVDALAYIGSEAALAVLESYAADTRILVNNALGRAWERFDRHEYARRVLTRVSRLSFTHHLASELLPLQALTQLTDLAITNTPVSDLTPLQVLGKLTRLSVARTQVSDLAPLRVFVGLTHLSLDSTPVNDLTPLQALTSLTELGIERTQVSDLTPLQKLAGLPHIHLERAPVSYLSVTGSRIRNWGNLRGRPGLQIKDVSLGGIVGQLIIQAARGPIRAQGPEKPWGG